MERNGVAGRASRTPTSRTADVPLARAAARQRAAAGARARRRRADGPQVRHVIVSGIVAGEVAEVRAGYEAVGFGPRRRGRRPTWIAMRLGARMAELLDPARRRARARRSGSSRPPGRRRAADLRRAAGRVQLPRGDPARAGAVPARPHAAAGDARARAAPARRPRAAVARRGVGWDGYRDPRRARAPLELRGVLRHPGRPVLAWVHVLSFTDRDARRHALRRQGGDQRPRRVSDVDVDGRCCAGTSGSSGRCRGARRATRTRCSSRR